MKIKENTKKDDAQSGPRLDVAVCNNELELTHSKCLRELVGEIITLTGKTAGKYLELCQYIRFGGTAGDTSKAVAPKLATNVLLEAGMHKVKVSEIVRIAHASNENWSKFSAGMLSIKGVLSLERGNVQELLAESLDESVTDIKVEIEETGALERAEHAAKSEEELEAASEKRCQNAAAYILRYMSANETKSKTWRASFGEMVYVLKLSRESKKGYGKKEGAKSAGPYATTAS